MWDSKRDTDVKNSLWTLWEKARVGWLETIALIHVVQCMWQGAQGWCTGMTLNDGMRREVGGSSGQGTHVHPWLIHIHVWQKPLQYCKVVSLQQRSNKPILMEISPGCLLEGLMLKLKLQYFGHLMQRADSLEKTLMLGRIEGRRRRGRQQMRWLDGIIDLMDMHLGDSGSWWWTGRPGVLWFMGRKESDTTERLNWTEN